MVTIVQRLELRDVTPAMRVRFPLATLFNHNTLKEGEMGRRDIQAVYCLNSEQHEAFSMYWEGNSVAQIGQALNMTTSHAGKVLDEARDHVYSTMSEKREAHGLPTEQHDSTQEGTSNTGSSPGQYNLLSVRTPVDGPRKRSDH